MYFPVFGQNLRLCPNTGKYGYDSVHTRWNTDQRNRVSGYISRSGILRKNTKDIVILCFIYLTTISCCGILSHRSSKLFCKSMIYSGKMFYSCFHSKERVQYLRFLLCKCWIDFGRTANLTFLLLFRFYINIYLNQPLPPPLGKWTIFKPFHTEQSSSNTEFTNSLPLLLCKTHFFHLGFFSRTFAVHRTAGEGEGYFCRSSLPLPPASKALRH